MRRMRGVRQHEAARLGPTERIDVDVIQPTLDVPLRRRVGRRDFVLMQRRGREIGDRVVQTHDDGSCHAAGRYACPKASEAALTLLTATAPDV